MLDIPSDIWHYIAQFIPDSTFDNLNLFDVCSVFFNRAMNQKYKKICVDSTNLKMMWTLSRLRDPAVSRRVRYLHVERYSGEPFVLTAPRVHTRRLRISNAVTPSSIAQATPISSNSNAIVTFDDVLRVLISVLPALVQVTELSVDWWYLSMRYDISVFLRAAWNNLGPRLRKLTLKGNVESYSVFLSTSGPLPGTLKALKDLDLEFIKYAFFGGDDTDSFILHYTVAPFINQLCSQLHCLKLTSWGPTDLSNFMKRLGPFPNLRHLRLYAPFHDSFGRDISGLTRILRDQSGSLQNIDLNLWIEEPSFLARTDEIRLNEWLTSIVVTPRSAITFSNLQTLVISPATRTPPAAFDTLIAFIKRSSDTLIDLTVRDYHLSNREVKDILSALTTSRGLTNASQTSRLRRLRLHIRKLSPQLISLLAQTLPNLEDLALNINRLHPSNEFSYETGTTQAFCRDMQNLIFKDWKLYDLSIWQGSTKLDEDVMRTIARCIPNLESFWSQGCNISSLSTMCKHNY